MLAALSRLTPAHRRLVLAPATALVPLDKFVVPSELDGEQASSEPRVRSASYAPTPITRHGRRSCAKSSCGTRRMNACATTTTRWSG